MLRISKKCVKFGDWKPFLKIYALILNKHIARGKAACDLKADNLFRETFETFVKK